MRTVGCAGFINGLSGALQHLSVTSCAAVAERFLYRVMPVWLEVGYTRKLYGSVGGSCLVAVLYRVIACSLKSHGRYALVAIILFLYKSGFFSTLRFFP